MGRCTACKALSVTVSCQGLRRADFSQQKSPPALAAKMDLRVFLHVCVLVKITEGLETGGNLPAASGLSKNLTKCKGSGRR